MKSYWKRSTNLKRAYIEYITKIKNLNFSEEEDKNIEEGKYNYSFLNKKNMV